MMVEKRLATSAGEWRDALYKRRGPPASHGYGAKTHPERMTRETLGWFRKARRNTNDQPPETSRAIRCRGRAQGKLTERNHHLRTRRGSQ